MCRNNVSREIDWLAFIRGSQKKKRTGRQLKASKLGEMFSAFPRYFLNCLFILFIRNEEKEEKLTLFVF